MINRAKKSAEATLWYKCADFIVVLEQPYLIPTLQIGGALENARLKINIASNLLASFSTDTHLLSMGLRQKQKNPQKSVKK